MSDVKTSQLNAAQITLLRLLDRTNMSAQEIQEIQDLIGDYFDRKLKSQLLLDFQNNDINEKDFESLRQGNKPLDVVQNRKGR